MNDNLLALCIIATMFCSILFGISSFNAINNLADALDTSYNKGYYCKTIGFTIFSIISGYVLYLIINVLIKNV